MTDEVFPSSATGAMMAMDAAPSSSTLASGEASTAELAASAVKFAARARSPRTIAEYGKDWTRFKEFCALHSLRAMPADPATVVLWATDLARRYQPSTIDRRIAAIAAAHKAQGHTSPTLHPTVSEVRKGIHRAAAEAAAAKGNRNVVHQAAALSQENLFRVISSIHGDTPKDERDRALLLTGFAGYFRRSELAAITFEQIETTDTGVRIHLPQAKADQFGRGTWRDIAMGDPVHGPVAVLNTWFATANIETGPVFRPINKAGRIVARALSDRAVYNIIRDRTTAALGDTASFSAHSLRRGAASTAARLGADQLAIARAGGWADNSATIARYIDAASTATPDLGL